MKRAVSPRGSRGRTPTLVSPCRYDRQKLTLKEVHNCQYVACMNPTSGSFTIDPRLQVGGTQTHLGKRERKPCWVASGLQAHILGRAP